MSTRSRIGYVERNGWIVSSYCKWDGYPANNGDLLLRHYTELGKVKNLVWLGSLSSLHAYVSTRHPHTFENPRLGITVAYMRDRGDERKDCVPRIDLDETAFMRSDIEEWGYLFKDGKWYVIDGHVAPENRTLVELTDAFIDGH